jgi:sulfate transport system permease protein
MSRSSKRVLPGFGLTLGSTLLCISLLTLLPLAALVFKASDLSIKEFWEYVSDPRAISTYKVTVSAALIALVVNLVTGVWIAWILVRYDFPGRRLLDALVDLPFALPTAVAGISLAALTGPYGPIGKLFAYWDIQIAYAFPGIVVAMIFTSFPFVIRTVQPVLEDLDVILEESSTSLGAKPWQVFRRVILPELYPAIIAGGGVSLVRSLGEFGALVFISGNKPYQTEFISLLVYTRIEEFDYPGAAALSIVILAFAFIVLLTMNIVQHILIRRLRG